MDDIYSRKASFAKNGTVILIGLNSEPMALAHLCHALHQTHMPIGMALPVNDYQEICTMNDVAIFHELRMAIKSHSQDIIAHNPEMKPVIDNLVELISKIELNLLPFLPKEILIISEQAKISEVEIKEIKVHLFSNYGLRKYWGSHDKRYLKRIQGYNQRVSRRTKRRSL